MGPLGMPELIVICVMLALFALVAAGIVVLVLFLRKRDRRAGEGTAHSPRSQSPQD